MLWCVCVCVSACMCLYVCVCWRSYRNGHDVFERKVDLLQVGLGLQVGEGAFPFLRELGPEIHRERR